MNHKYPQIPFHVEKLTNQTAIDLHLIAKSYNGIGCRRILHHWFCKIWRINPDNVLPSSLQKRIIGTKNRRKYLKTCRKAHEAVLFLTEPFKPPKGIRKAVPSTEILAMKKKVNTKIIQLGNKKKKIGEKGFKTKERN